MTRPNQRRDDLRAVIAGALDLLRADADFAPLAEHGRTEPALPPPPLPGLLAQCRALLDETRGTTKPPVRTLHHLACTGGTILSRCLGAMPNVQLLSEVDPLSTNSSSRFVPTNLIGLAQFGSRPADAETLIDLFLSGLAVLSGAATAAGRDLVLRDHSHSHFCHGPAIPDRRTLREIVAAAHPVRSAVTVRHPFDSFLALHANRWLHFAPPTPDEYARRYHAFLDRHADLEILRYEDFLADPEGIMQRLCGILDLSYNPLFRNIFPAIRLSGNSGRSGDVLAPRPRRQHDRARLDEALGSPHFVSLLGRLAYDL